MEELVELLPPKLVALILAPFAVGLVLLALLVRPTPTGQTVLFLLAFGGVSVFVLLGGTLLLLLKQNQGIDRVNDLEE